MLKLPNNPRYTVSYQEFSQRPLSDSCWSLQTGPDGRIYAACCIEHTGGQSVTVVRYCRASDSLEYLFDVDEVTGDLRDSGRATQCKIHYSFVPDPTRDILYSATHLSGPPKGERSYNPWAAWHDAKRAFRGASLVAYDTRRDCVLDARLMIPQEGCRCLCIDIERQRLYALTYPRDHFVIYELSGHELIDKGRIGSVNSQCLFIDGNGRVYSFSDSGRMWRYDPDSDAVEQLPWTYAHEPCQSPWHGVLYDAVADPTTGAVYMVPWKSRPHLMRYWPEEGVNGRLEDLGRVTQAGDPHHPIGVNLDHVGGLLFGDDGWLHYVKSVWQPRPGRLNESESAVEASQAVLCRMHPESLVHEELCALALGAGRHHYISRGAKDPHGDFCFGKIMAHPAGIYRVEVQPEAGCAVGSDWLRLWG